MLTLLLLTGNILGITQMPTMIPDNQLMTPMATVKFDQLSAVKALKVEIPD
jgi:hypothetical protein